MQTPHHMSLDNFVAEKAMFLATACLEHGDQNMNCAQCGTPIQWEVAFISTHSEAYLCIATGKINEVDIPYCPHCEEAPYPRGCFHVHKGKNVAAQLAS